MLKPDSEFSALRIFFFNQCAAEMKYKIIIYGTDFDETAKGMGCMYICLHTNICKSRNYDGCKDLMKLKWIKIIEFS